MHEFGPAEGIRDAVLRRAGDRPVRRIRVRAGALHRFDEEAMRQALTFVAAGTPLAGAGLDLVVVPAEAVCRSGGHVTETDVPLPACPVCGGTLDLRGGDEVVLESVEYAPPPEPQEG